MNILLIGDGQLGNMLGRSAIQHGHACLLYSTRTQQVMPLAADQALPLSLTQAVEWADVVSWEHEAVPADVIDVARDKFLMDPEKITALTDRRTEKQLFDDCLVPTSPWRSFDSREELAALVIENQNELVIKAATGGYDGKGQWRTRNAKLSEKELHEAGAQPGIAEDKIPFEFEVSLVGARSSSGEISCYPLIQNVHDRGILSYSLGGFEAEFSSLQQHAEQYFNRLTQALDYVGVLAIEFFVVKRDDGYQLLVNEIAPRVHNSGHWTQTGANCDQFSLHIRALTETPFPELMVTPTLMINAIGINGYEAALWQSAIADCHWYNKEPRPGRKVGHINFVVDSIERAEQLAQQWAPKLQVLAQT